MNKTAGRRMFIAIRDHRPTIGPVTLGCLRSVMSSLTLEQPSAFGFELVVDLAQASGDL